MIKEFNNESQTKAIADSLGLFMTKYKGVYIVSNSKEELLANYNLAYYSKEGIFYDRDIFEEDGFTYLVIRNKDIVDASLIELPYGLKSCATMFSGCTSLKVPPTIPVGIEDCSFLFENCTSLEIPPEIPKGVTNCNFMFTGCASLKVPPIISEGVTTCKSMLKGCISLATAPILPNSVEACVSMFNGCTSLEKPPKIPDNAAYCLSMFQGCSSLKELPHFPENCDTAGALWCTPFKEFDYDKEI